MNLLQTAAITLATALGAIASPPGDRPDKATFQRSCASIASELNLVNATVYFSEFVGAKTTLSLPDNNSTCGQPSQVVSTDLCRIALYVATSQRSGINMEAWLPKEWTGRFLSTGNGGLGGCE